MSSIEPGVTGKKSNTQPSKNRKFKLKSKGRNTHLPLDENDELRLRRLKRLLDVDDAVIGFEDWCWLIGVSAATGRRIIAAGGITVTWLSDRRMGIRSRHCREHLDRGAASTAAGSQGQRVPGQEQRC